MNTITEKSNTSSKNAYVLGQQNATKHQQAKIALLIAIRERSEENVVAAIAASDRAAASDLAFVAPDLAFAASGEENEDGLAVFAEAHKERAAALFARKQSNVLAGYRNGYQDTICASGSKSKNNGDPVALALAGLTAGNVMRAAEILLGMPLGELAEKYGHLNEGQKRMNSGNRIRNGFKKQRFSVADIEIAIEAAINTQ